METKAELDCSLSKIDTSLYKRHSFVLGHYFNLCINAEIVLVCAIYGGSTVYCAHVDIQFFSCYFIHIHFQAVVILVVFRYTTSTAFFVVGR